MPTKLKVTNHIHFNIYFLLCNANNKFKANFFGIYTLKRLNVVVEVLPVGISCLKLL